MQSSWGSHRYIGEELPLVGYAGTSFCLRTTAVRNVRTIPLVSSFDTDFAVAQLASISSAEVVNALVICFNLLDDFASQDCTDAELACWKVVKLGKFPRRSRKRPFLDGLLSDLARVGPAHRGREKMKNVLETARNLHVYKRLNRPATSAVAL